MEQPAPAWRIKESPLRGRLEGSEPQGGSRCGATYLDNLWTHACRLGRRAEAARGAEASFFREEAEKAMRRLERHLGRRPRNHDELRTLLEGSRN